MERNRGSFRGKDSGRFPQRDRDDNSRKPWRSNFNSNQPNNWIQNNSQQISPWSTKDDSWQNNHNRSDSWQNNSRPDPWVRNADRGWPQNAQEDSSGGYWRQISGNSNDSGAWQSKGNYNRERDHRTPYDRPRNDSRDRQQNRSRGRGRRGRPDFDQREPQRDQSPEVEIDTSVPLSPLEAKIERLITAVQSQPDYIGHLILLQNNNEIPPVLLNNAAHQVKNCELAIDRDESTGYSKLRINTTVIAEGMYSSKKDAKEALYEMGLEILKGKCFYITSKSHYEEVSMDDLSNQKNQIPENNTMDASSKALQMMLKMGWGGKGLGTKEQGEQKTVADKIVENISREGLGTGGQTVMQEVDKILADYARSTKTITLGFDSGFTKEERGQIHGIAAKYHLKSKSEGGFNNRRITISKKFSKWVLIRELLSVGLENESYILSIPDEYQHLWTDDDEKDDS